MPVETEDVNEAFENYVDILGEFLEHSGFSDDQIDDYFLEHHGVKGMRWGQRRSHPASLQRRTSPMERKQGRQEVRDVAKSAREIIRESRNARTPEARKAAANRYQREVLSRVKSDSFRAAYRNANTMGRGEITAHILIYGPFSSLTIPAARRAYDIRAVSGPSAEQTMAREILREMREP